jgi:outer membrane cobalamin receptor
MARPGGARLCLALIVLGPAFAGRGDEPSAQYGEELTVVGTRPRTVAAGDPTAAATVVDARQFAGEVKTVAELISTAPGVAVHQYGGIGRLATVSIRGSTADQVQVFLDGLPLNTAAGGGVDLSRIPRTWIERIEVVRGAEGARYGAGTLGGVVNIVTHRATAGTWSAEATAGSFDTYAGSANGSTGGQRWGAMGAVALDRTGGRFGYLFDPQPALSGSPLEERVRDHNASFTVGGLAKGWAAVGQGRLDALVLATAGERDLPGSPYYLTPDDWQHDALLAATTRLAYPLSEAIDLLVTAGLRDEHLTVALTPNPEARQHDRLVGGGTGLRWRAGPNTLTLGVDASAEWLAAEGNPDHGRDLLALWAFDDLRLAGDRLRLAAGLRWDAQGPFDGLSGSVGASVRLAGPLSARASTARSFRPPSFAELYLSQGLLSPNPDLVPETSWSADAGLVAEGRLGLASAGVFTQQYQDLIVYEPDSFRRYKPFNDGKAAASGVEAELASAPVGPAGLSASAAYTFLATETLRGDALVLGKELPHRARHRLFARVGAERGALAGHVEAHYLSSQYQDLSNSPALRVPSALTFNTGGSVRLARRPDTRLHLEIRNVLDDRSLQDGFGNPLPGRMVMLTLRVAGGKEAP